MKLKLFFGAIAGATMLAVTAFGPARADGKMIVVACDGAILDGVAIHGPVVDTIGEALKRARPGTEINIFGTCTENAIVRTSNLELVCVHGATIVAPPGDPSTIAIQVRANDVVIRNCHFTGPSSNGTGVVVMRSGSAALIHITAYGLRGGVSVTQASYARVVGGSNLSYNRTGLVISNASHADVAFSLFSQNDTGILVTRSSAGELVGNDILYNSGNGVTVLGASVAEFSRDVTLGNAPNRIMGNGNHGIFCARNSDVNIGAPQIFGGGNGGQNVLITGSCTGP